MYVELAVVTAKNTPLNEYQSGVSAKFLRLDSKWGIKLYKSERERNYTYRLQKIASKQGLAPQVRDVLCLEIDDKMYYGYLTECVTETALERWINENDLPELKIMNRDERGDAYYDAGSMLDDSQEFTDLTLNMEESGFQVCDMHAANVGWLPDGRLVCIDFDCSYYKK